MAADESRRPAWPPTWRWVAAAVIFALAVRLAYVLTLPAPANAQGLPFDDERVYLSVAQNFIAGNGLVQEPGNREASKAPGYPLILAALNPAADFPAFVRRVRLVQSVASAATCLLVWLLARRLFGERAAAGAIWLAALYPFFVFYCGELLSETFFIAALLGGVILLDMACHDGLGGRAMALWRRRLAAAIGAGIILGAATLIRSSALLFLPFFLPFWLAVARRPRHGEGAAGLPIALALFAAAAAAFAFTLLPWVTRNYRKFHAFIPTSLQTGESLYEANSPYADGGPGWHLVDWKKESGGRQLDELENDRFWRRKALEWIRQHPGAFARLALVKLGRFWSPIPNYQGGRTPLLIAVSLMSYVPVMALGLVGLALSVRRRRILILLAPVVYYAALHAVFVGSIRYRTPIMPYFMCLAGVGLVWLLSRLRRRRSQVAGDPAHAG